MTKKTEQSARSTKTSVIALILAGLIAFLYVSGLPGILFIEIELFDVQPELIAVFINTILALLLGLILHKVLIPDLELGLGKSSLKAGLEKYLLSCLVILLIPLIAFSISLQPFDRSPTIVKLLFEGIVYIAAVALIEEFFCRGLLQNALANLFHKNKNSQLLSVLVAAFIFGAGHVFGMIGEAPILVVCKVLWSIGLGIYFGSIYTLTANLVLVAFFHFIINLSGFPFIFSTQQTYPTDSVIALVLASIGAAGYGIYLLQTKQALAKQDE